MNINYCLSEKDTEGDPEYTVAVVPVGSLPDFYPSNDSDYIQVPERIMQRILGVASAYNLHFVEHVSPNRYDRWAYRGAQIESLEDELEFLFNLVNDDFLKQNIIKIQEILKKALTKASKLELVFEGP